MDGEQKKQPKKGKEWLIAGVLILVIVAIGIYDALSGPKPAPPGPAPELSAEVTPEFADETHISLSGAFSVTNTGITDADELSMRLVFDPLVEYRLKPQEESGDWLLETYRPLEAGRTLSVSFYAEDGSVAERWEFMTEDTFRVAGVFPANGAADVPTGSSMEITLSYGDLDAGVEENPGQYITVSPEFPYRSMLRGSTLIVVPEEDFLPAMTTFTVTLSGEIPRENGDTVGEDFTFTFTTGPEESREFMLNTRDRMTENIIPGDDVFLKVSVGEALETQNLTTTVWRCPDADHYLGLLRSYRDYRISRSYRDSGERYNDYWEADTHGLEEVMRFEAPTTALDDWAWSRYVILPETLDAGWYIARLEAALPSGGSVHAYKLIQVSSLSVYYAQPSGWTENEPNQLLAWVNDAQTGKAVAGADVSVTASNYRARASTGSDGIALPSGTVQPLNRSFWGWEENEHRNTDVYGIFSVHSEGNAFHDLYGRYYLNEKSASNEYMSYLFTDRPLYHRTDTVQVWGVVKPYKEGTPLPDTLYLELSNAAIRQPVTPGTDGTFMAEIALENQRNEYDWLYLRDDRDNSYSSTMIRCRDYVKPEYRTEAVPDRLLYDAWENSAVGIDFSAAWYEGTPAREYSAVVRPPDGYEGESFPFSEVPLLTDEDGNARIAFTPATGENYHNDWRPLDVYYAVASNTELNSPQVNGGSVHYLFRDVALRLEKGEDGKSVVARTNHIDTSRIREETDLLDEENLLGEGADVALRADIHKIYYVKTPNGERYDAVNKVAVTAYEYEYTDEVVDTLNVTATDGVYIFENLPQGENETSWYVEITATDKRGLPVVETLYYSENLQRRSETSHSYQFFLRDADLSNGSEDIWSTDYIGHRFTDGEAADFKLTDYREYVDDPDGKILFLTTQDNILDYGVADGTAFHVDHDDRHLPNYMVFGAYFDGRYIYATQFTQMTYNPEKRALDIAVEPEKESFDPGSTAAVTLRATDANTGAPAADTQIVAAVVDEAVFAIQEQTVDFRDRLYETKMYSFVIQYTSYNNEMIDGGGRGGGGPDVFPPRIDFRDTAAFEVVTTGPDGTATLNVSLPDSLTSWRVTALALSPDRKAGDTKDNFTVTKDFFISPALPPRYLAGDDVTFTIHSAGRDTMPDDPVSYSVSVEGTDIRVEVSGKAGDFTPVRLEALPEGTHSITVRGTQGELQDAVTLPVDVVKSGISVTVNSRMTLDEAASLHSESWPVTLGFYDRAWEVPADILSYLAANSEGTRADQRAAKRYLAEYMLASGLDSRQIDGAALTDDLADLCPDYYLYRLFPYSEESMVLTARIMMGAPDTFRGGPGFEPGDIAGLELPADRAAAWLLFSSYFGVDGILEGISGQLEDSTAYGFAPSMHLTAALYRAEDSEGALAHYARLTQPVLQKQMDADGNALLYAAENGRPDYEGTAAALLAASVLEHPDAQPLARWMLQNPSPDDLYNLELMAYLRTVPAPKSSASLSFTLNGEEKTLTPENGVAYRSFTREQLANAAFSSRGEILVNATYAADYESAMGRENNRLTVTKAIDAPAGGTLRQGDLARITVRVEIPDDLALDPESALKIDDYVPTGMRFERMEETGYGWSTQARNDQRLTFVSSIKEAGELVYYARCVAPGSYVGESAFAGTAGSVWGASERLNIDIEAKAGAETASGRETESPAESAEQQD